MTGWTSRQTVLITATDSDNAEASTTFDLTVLSTGVHLVDGCLYINGTDQRDHITIRAQVDGSVDVTAPLIDVKSEKYFGIEKIVVRGKDGKDVIRTHGSITVPMTIDGGDDNDHLYGSSGDDLLIGGPGNDRLYGGSGEDTLIAGSGYDYLDGGTGNDFIDGGPGQRPNPRPVGQRLAAGAASATIVSMRVSATIWPMAVSVLTTSMARKATIH